MDYVQQEVSDISEVIDQVEGTDPLNAVRPSPRVPKGKKGGRGIRLGALVVGALFVAFATFLATRKPASTQSSPSPLLFRSAPVLSGPLLDGGKTMSLSNIRGKFVLVNFFASWCSSCKTEMPQLVAFAKSEANTVEVLGVDYDDQSSSAVSFLGSYGAKWPVIVDANGQSALRWGVSEPPESFLVAPDGKVVTKIIGPVTARELSLLVQIAQSKGY